LAVLVAVVVAVVVAVMGWFLWRGRGADVDVVVR